MKDEFGNIVKVACIYMATIIGAGFASGQEIMQFFTSYYKGGFYGIILAGVLFALVGYIVLDKVYSERIRNYDEFIFPMVGYFFGWVVQIIVTLFMLSVFCIMASGMGGILKDKFGVPYNLAIIIMIGVCMAVILTDIKGVAFLSTVVSPVLIAGMVLIGLYILIFKDTSVFNIKGIHANITENWVFSAFIYVSYNTLTATIVLCNLLPYLKTRRTGIAGGVMGGLMLCLAAFVLNSAMFIFYPDAISRDMPILRIVENRNVFLSGLYTVVLWLAMLVSAVTSGYCFIDRIKSKIKINKLLLAIVIAAITIILARFGFSGLIAAIYPMFGYAGLFLLVVILLQSVNNLSFSKKKK